MIVVSDASPLNVLVRIGYIDVLCPLFGSVIIPPAVASELSHAGTPKIVRDWLTHCPAWLEIRSPSRIDETLQMDDLGEGRGDQPCPGTWRRLPAGRRQESTSGRPRTWHPDHRGVIGILELASARRLLDLNEAFRRIRGTDFKIAERILKEALERDAARKSSFQGEH